MMGMSLKSYYLSWYIWFSGISIFMSIIITILVNVFIYENQPGILIFFLFFMFFQILIFMAFTIQSFFSNAKSGLIAGIFIYLIFYNARTFNGQNVPTWNSNRLICISPVGAMYLCLKSLLFL